jgi:hypothetical protein
MEEWGVTYHEKGRDDKKILGKTLLKPHFEN